MRWTGVPDYCSADGARELAAQLTSFWDRRGAVVMTRVETYHSDKSAGHTIYCVRSSLCNGWPVYTDAVRKDHGRDPDAAAQAERMEDEQASGTEDRSAEA